MARRTAVRLSDLDSAGLGAVAAEKARAGADPVDLEPGHYEVVLEPSCGSNLLYFLSWYGFNARAVADGQSFARVGAAQFDPAIRLVDDPTDALAGGLPYDLEGTPRRPLTLVDAGTTAALTHDRRTAAAAGAETRSTGHAVTGGERLGPVATELRLAPGTGGTTADLVRNIRRGLLVSDFWYTRVLDPRTLVVTGLTRNGVWLVADGEIVAPVRNPRFTQSFPDALGPGAVLGVGSDPAPVPALLGSTYAVPSLHLARWQFTGGSAG